MSFSLKCIFKTEWSDGVIVAINTLKEETIQSIYLNIVIYNEEEKQKEQVACSKWLDSFRASWIGLWLKAEALNKE